MHDDKSIWQNKKFRTTDNAVKRLATVREALRSAGRPQDEAFLIEAMDPTPYWIGGKDDHGKEVEGILDRLRNQEGWRNFEYRRGNDWAQFPGRPALEQEGVTITLLPYTQGVSSTALRKKGFILSMKVLPEWVLAPILEAHENLVYAPLRLLLEAFCAATSFAVVASPNAVTCLGALCAVPFVVLNVYGCHLAAA